MCGRYGLVPEKNFADEFEINNRGKIRFPPSYNVSPASTNPIITINSPKTVHLAYWGLIPFWAKDRKNGFATINARSEEACEKPLFRGPFKNGRCLIPISFYFEFAHRKDNPKVKIPYLFRLKNQNTFVLAGLYSTWHDPVSDKDILTYAILTTQANELGAKVHSRMPCILHKKDWNTWADITHFDIVLLQSLLKPFLASDMECWPVSQNLNNAQNDSEELIKPVNEVPISPSKPAWEEKQK